MNKKVVLFTEYIDVPYDEGIKKTVYNLYSTLNKKYNLLVFCRKGLEGKKNVKEINANKLFYNKEIKQNIKKFKPDILIYFPFASSTFAGYLRMKVISKYYYQSKKILIALQPKPLKGWQQFLVNFIKPQMVLTPSLDLKHFLDLKRIPNQLFPLYTDLDNFKPLVAQSVQNELRKKYNLPENKYIISHIGHLNEGRNLLSLIPLQEAGYQVIIIGSSSTPIDALGPESLKDKLKKSGIIIIEKYIDKIEEIYQLSDLYIFPVVHKTGSIGTPLSILEARACGIPVLTTDFGSIQEFLGNDHDGIFYSKPEHFLAKLNEIKKNNSSEFTKTKISQLNEKYFNTIFNTIERIKY
ncbi:hypothetical protein ES705_36994 [subsurface metagenome]